ncbi:plasmid replication initiator TrfA [Massilia sp. YMA4]|uniref:plasmid replication initiator TrfA n=1 Tax=Massilia sp. YMA4 TaxID=1593482 RepID=UPI000DD12259|nr:plasmid replication initiator TrfA [Massilia sp. YMA4]AXA90539.1 plasmid stabilization protein [Massilia sp. YMA4]
MSSSLFSRFPTLAARVAEAQSRIEVQREAVTPQQLFLPGLEDFMRAMPNHIARSSLFAPVARGRKRIHKDVVLISRADAVIKFWGEQLDESQADVWMQAMYEASRRPLGEPVVIKRAEFLRSIGRQTGNYEYKWLNRTMQTLTFAMLVIEVRTKDGKPKLSVGKNRALHMIEGFDFDDEAEAYTLRVDPRWRVMFGNREFALIDWEKRKRFGAHQDMAKALQRLAATSDESIQRYALDWLKEKLEYTGRMRDFVDAMGRAMRELERLEIIAGGRIESSTKGRTQAVWTKL